MGTGTNSSYMALKTDVLNFLRTQSVDGRIQAMVLDLVNQALRANNVTLSNNEKEALSREILKDILQELLANQV